MPTCTRASPWPRHGRAKAQILQIFLGDPQGWKKPPDRSAETDPLTDAGIGLYVHAPYLVNVATTNNKIRIPSRKILDQHAEAAAALGARGLIVHGGHMNDGDDPQVGFDNWRKVFERAHVRRCRSSSRTPPAATTRWPAGWTGSPGSGTRSASSTPASASTPATRTPAARSCSTSSTGSRRSPAGSTWCTPTAPGTCSAPGADRHANLTDGHIDPERDRRGLRRRRGAVLVETPGLREGQGADIAFLRERLPA